MAKIRQLDEILSNKIAAGEVVERPMSVVKELVENSIDAASSRIDIFIEEGGLSLIKVVDNGEGMERTDAMMCFSRHATSKIKNDQDLFHIMTLGFRGEAIPSIASISHFELMTKSGDIGTKIVYEFGKYKYDEVCECSKGTTISVTKLFQNVPARLKYLKSVNTEFSTIHHYIERIALAYPHIAIGLYHNDKKVFQTNGKGQLLEVIASIYGIATAKNMIPVRFGNDEFEIDGYISKIDTSRASKSNIITLVNHRYVKNVMSIDAIASVYKQYLLDNRYPIAVINIEVDPYLVDVNVHPSKLEVKFSKEQSLKELIVEGVLKSLKDIDLTYQVKNKETERKTFKPDLNQVSFDFSVEELKPTVSSNTIIKEEKVQYNDVKTLEPEVKKEVQYVHDYKKPEFSHRPLKEKIYAKAQIHGTYLIGENEKGMYLLDQHAAQERINYEYYKEQFSYLDLTMQALIVPLSFEYSASECMLIEERKHLLEKVGIYLELFGEHRYIVRNLPMWMKNINENIFVDEMIQMVIKKNSLDVVEMQEHAIATLSCKASLKANTYLSQFDMQVIFDNLMRCDNPYVCPHGRPTLLFYSEYELEKLFKRVV